MRPSILKMGPKVVPGTTIGAYCHEPPVRILIRVRVLLQSKRIKSPTKQLFLFSTENIIILAVTFMLLFTCIA